MIVKYPPATNGNLARELGMSEPTRTIQDGFHLGEAMEVAKSRALAWAANHSVAQWVGL